MKLIIDQGNTLTKVAFFDGKKLIKKNTFNTVLEVKPLLKLANRIIFSSVANQFLPSFLQSCSNLLHFTTQTSIPISHFYKTPESLGVDRLAAVLGARSFFANKNILVIDAGTCITFDFIRNDGVFLGGAISPGLKLRYKSLNDYTANLPLLNYETQPSLVGNCTENAIHSGVVNGIIAEIDGVIRRYKENYTGVKVVLTGGDANIFDKELKNTIFACPELVLVGLNEILDYNEATF